MLTPHPGAYCIGSLSVECMQNAHKYICMHLRCHGNACVSVASVLPAWFGWAGLVCVALVVGGKVAVICVLCVLGSSF